MAVLEQRSRGPELLPQRRSHPSDQVHRQMSKQAQQALDSGLRPRPDPDGSHLRRAAPSMRPGTRDRRAPPTCRQERSVPLRQRRRWERNSRHAVSWRDLKMNVCRVRARVVVHRALVWQARCTTLAGWTAALEDIGSVYAVLFSAASAFQNVNRLAIVRPLESRRTDDQLSVAVHVAGRRGAL
jgi:hypothetical protein